MMLPVSSPVALIGQPKGNKPIGCNNNGGHSADWLAGRPPACE